MENINETKSYKPFYFYHMTDKNNKVDRLGLISLEYMYQHNMTKELETSYAKYRDRLVNGWGIYPGRDPNSLTNEEIYNGLKQFRANKHGGTGNDEIYFFRYPPYRDLHPQIRSLLNDRIYYRIDINDPALKPYIKIIHWGWKDSHTANDELKRLWYEKVSVDEYFDQFDSKKQPLFSTLWHIKIITTKGYIPAKFVERIKTPNTRGDIKRLEGEILEEACKDVATARKFVRDVGKLAKKYDANYFVVTDGASGKHNPGQENDAVEHARQAHTEWERRHGIDPDHDWSNESYTPNTDYMESLEEAILPNRNRSNIIKNVNQYDNIFIKYGANYKQTRDIEISNGTSVDKAMNFMVKHNMYDTYRYWCYKSISDTNLELLKKDIRGLNREVSKRGIHFSINKYYSKSGSNNYNVWIDIDFIDKTNESSIKRSEVDTSDFGLPDLRKYPMPDKDHVLSAIKFFNYVSPANEKELAINIKKKMKQYNISPDKIGKKNRLKKYLTEDTDMIQELCFDSLDYAPILVFDIGDVLAHYKKKMIDAICSNKAIKHGEELWEYIMDTFNKNSKYLDCCSYNDYVKYMTNNAPNHLKQYITTALSIDINNGVKFDYTDSLLRDLKSEGYPIYYLSNWSRWSRDALVKNNTFDFLKYFDGGIFSCDCGLSKPDEKIYKKLFEKYNLNPGHTIFFDDRHENISAAINCGMTGILFDHKYTPQWIRDYFIK